VSESRAPLVLFRTKFFQIDPLDQIPNYEWKDRFTSDQSRLNEADAVVFHIPDLRETPIVTPRRPGQVWVAWCKESTVNFPELIDPDFMRPYDLTMTYQRSSDIWAPYIPSIAGWRHARHSVLPQRTATAPVAMFQSSPLDHSGRIGFAAEMMQYIEVHSYGHILNNRTLPGPDLKRVTKQETIAAYPFCLAFENSIAPDYVTEKIYDCLMARTVPIYLGTHDVAEFVPERSYIDATAHGGPRGLAAYLQHLLERPDEYRSYLSWRDKPLPAGLAALTQSASIDNFLRLLDQLRPRADAPPIAINLSARTTETEMPVQCDDGPPADAGPDSAVQSMPVRYSLDSGGPDSSEGPEHLRRLISFANNLSPPRIKIIKAAMIATVWLVGLVFLDVGWPSPLLAATATLGWLAGARWIQHLGAAALVVSILVRIGALPPPADWRTLVANSRAPVAVAH
jgi:hypothetical protein